MLKEIGEFKIYFLIWLLKRLIYAGLEPVLSHSENDVQRALQTISTNNEIKIILIKYKLIPVLLARAFDNSRLTKRVLIL